MATLPPHTALIANPNVWMESAGIEQLARVASQPGCVRAVGMPDLHPGRGIPIGAAFAFEHCVLPDLVGGDAGCGVLTVVARRDGPRGDALERRVLAALEEPLLPDVPAEMLLQACWHKGPRGLLELANVPPLLGELASRYDDHEDASGALPTGLAYAQQLGSVGGGNHFAEIARVDKLHDRARARAFSLEPDAQVVLVHSGSRALGTALAERYTGQTLRGDAIHGYLADLRGAIRYARSNRLLMAWRILRAAGITSSGRVAQLFDIVHNAVERLADNTYLHRKGAAPAELGQPTVVLGSRGAPSWIMEGLGNAACLCCVAHGAGRRMARSEAYSKLRARYTRASLARSDLGSRVLCDDTTLMYEEHPDAYKPIEPVVQSLEEAGAARRLAALIPMITVKR